MESEASKSRLRARFRAARRALSPEAHAAFSDVLVARLAAMPEIQAAAVVHSFWPDAARGEPDLRPLLGALYAQGKTIVLPRVLSRNPAVMTYHVWEGQPLTLGAYGLSEPRPDAPRFAGTPGVILVPALAADHRGVRLGYGGGFYDRWLAGMDAFTVCPVFDAAFVLHLPSDPHDVPVRAVVTDARVWQVE